MATSIHNVRRNFIYQLEQIVPDCASIGRRFEAVDRLRLGDDGNTTGRARDFIVRRQSAEEDRQPTDMTIREAWHEYQVRIAYPTTLGSEGDLEDIILQDRHQVCERLRDSQYFVGYSGATSTSVGLLNRYRTEDTLDDTGPVWVVLYGFRCLIREDI